MKYAASKAPVNELIRQFVDIVASRNCRVRPARRTALRRRNSPKLRAAT
jgi:hypothetical protein